MSPCTVLWWDGSAAAAVPWQKERERRRATQRSSTRIVSCSFSSMEKAMASASCEPVVITMPNSVAQYGL